MNRKKIVAILMGVIISGNICNFNNLEVKAMESVESKIKEGIDKSNPEQYEMNIILHDLDIKLWNMKPYAPDEYGYPVDEPLGKYSEEEIKKYTDRNLKVEIDYGVGRMREIKENYFIQVVRVYENDEIISISAYAWENEIPYPSAYSNKLK